jgi:phosphate transport system permease protein
MAAGGFFLVGLPATLAIPCIALTLLALSDRTGIAMAATLLGRSLAIAALAILLSAPVGIGAGIFASEFLQERHRRPITLLLEGLGALPPVCAAWIALVLLAPWWERVVPSALAFLILFPLALTAFSLTTPWLPPRQLDRAMGLPMAFASLALALAIAAVLGLIDLAGHIPPVLLPSLHGELGAAVAITLFLAPKAAARSLAHLGRIPAHLREASLTCGATRWETTRRVVLPKAFLPLCFSMVELLAWAGGETMVVLVLCGSGSQAPWNGATLASALVLGLPDAAPGSRPEGQLLWCALFLLGIAVLAQVPHAVRDRRP